MDLDLKLFRITDYAIPLAILRAPAIQATIGEDGAAPMMPNVINEYWVGVVAGGKLAGCYRLHQLNGVCWQVHAFILPDYRREWSMKASKALLKWAVDSIEDLNKIICEVPAIYPNVIKHVEAQGFTWEGCNRGSFRKHGEIVDQIRFGITKEEITDGK